MEEGFENFYLYISNTFCNSSCEHWFNLHKNKDIDILHTIVCDLTGY